MVKKKRININLFEAFKLVFNTDRKLTTEEVYPFFSINCRNCNKNFNLHFSFQIYPSSHLARGGEVNFAPTGVRSPTRPKGEGNKNGTKI